MTPKDVSTSLPLAVSVIIPVYNAAPYLERCLRSAVAAVTAVSDPSEIIVVENGSTDASPSILEKWRLRYPALIRIIQCAKKGVAAARNCGVRVSSGKWLQFLDADDELLTDKLSRQLAISDGIAWIIGGYQDIRMNVPAEVNIPNSDLYKGLMFGCGTGHTNSNLLLRQTFLAVGGYDEDLATAEDLDLYRKLLALNLRVQIDPHVRSYYYHHVTDGSLSSYDQGATLHRRIKVYETFLAWIQRERPDYWQREQPFFVRALLSSIRILATYDAMGASTWYLRFQGMIDQVLRGSPSGPLPAYTRLYPYLGFHRVEWLRLKLARLLPEAVKRRLKA